jgi:Amidohydrolase family
MAYRAELVKAGRQLLLALATGLAVPYPTKFSPCCGNYSKRRRCLFRLARSSDSSVAQDAPGLFVGAKQADHDGAPCPPGLALATLTGVTVLVALVSEVFVEYRTLVGLERAIAVLDAAGPGGNYHSTQGIANMITEHAAGGAAPPGESVTLDQPLRMWTLWPARNNAEDHEKGSIEVGKFGDFAVLSADPRGRSASDVHAITTQATIVGGSVVYEAPST